MLFPFGMLPIILFVTILPMGRDENGDDGKQRKMSKRRI